MKLGTWVSNLRQKKRDLTAAQIEKLDKLGFSWDPFSEKWEEGFKALVSFHKRERHTRVPKAHKEGKVLLGIWLQNQRNQKLKLSSDRLSRLIKLGVSFDPFKEQWEASFAALIKYCERENHCLVPVTHREGGLNLGKWVSTQRLARDEMPADRRQRLNSLGFIWKA